MHEATRQGWALQVDMKDYILLLHKYAYENMNEGITFKDALALLNDNGIETGGPKFNKIKETYCMLIDNNYNMFSLLDPGEINYEHKHFMHPEAYFRYLDYVEMTEAREGSKRATTIAIAAIIVSIFSTFVQIYVQVKYTQQSK